MQIVIQSSGNQLDLIKDIAEWKREWDERLVNDDRCCLVEAIAFTPCYNGTLSALITFDVTVGHGTMIDLREVTPRSGGTSEHAVFSAMQEGREE